MFVSVPEPLISYVIRNNDSWICLESIYSSVSRDSRPELQRKVADCSDYHRITKGFGWTKTPLCPLRNRSEQITRRLVYRQHTNGCKTEKPRVRTCHYSGVSEITIRLKAERVCCVVVETLIPEIRD